MRRLFLALAICAVSVFAQAHRVSAATLSLTADRNNAAIGDTFTATLRIDSADVPVNAAQATISYPKDLVEATKIDLGESIFDFWLEKPPASDDTGSVSFTGGSSNGFKGRSLVVLKATFRVKGSGPIELHVSDAAVSASDGTGTNVLNEVRSAFITSIPNAGTWAAPPVTAPTSTTAAPPALIPLPPVQIKRTPAPATAKPVLPQLDVPLYPDPSRWYNAQDNFLVRWDLPNDVSDVATAFDHNPSTDPSKSEGLFDNKVFPEPDSGISYIHVRFKNAQGWGKTIHYRIAVDTVPPSPFTVLVEEGATVDTPTPTISYRTTDPVSSITGYLIHIDQRETVTTTKERFTLPVQPPGKHVIRVEALDDAGNSTEASVDFELTALPSPVLANIDKEVYIGEGQLNVGGGGMPSSTVVLALKTTAGQLVETREAVTDAQGNWHTVFEHSLVKGTYVIEAFTRDARGATSLVVKSDQIVVRARPFLILAGREVTETVFFSVIIALLLIGFVLGWISESLRKKRRISRSIISQRDTLDILSGIMKTTDTILRKYKGDKLGDREAFEAKQLLLRIQKKIKGTKGYLLSGMDELDK